MLRLNSFRQSSLLCLSMIPLGLYSRLAALFAFGTVQTGSLTFTPPEAPSAKIYHCRSQLVSFSFSRKAQRLLFDRSGDKGTILISALCLREAKFCMKLKMRLIWYLDEFNSLLLWNPLFLAHNFSPCPFDCVKFVITPPPRSKLGTPVWYDATIINNMSLKTRSMSSSVGTSLPGSVLDLQPANLIFQFYHLSPQLLPGPVPVV